MESFVYQYPMKVYFGKGSALQALDDYAEAMGKKVMLTYGGGSIKRNGIYDQLKGKLEELGKEVIDFSGIKSNPTYDKVQEGAKLAREENVDFILAVGGGSVIDCSKIISAQAKLDKDIWDNQWIDHQIAPQGIMMGAIVTASGTGAEMNNGAVITYEEKNWKGPVAGTFAAFSVLNPDYTMSVPASQVMSGAFDTLSHAMETYMGNSDQDNVSDDLCLAIMKNTVTNMRRLIRNIDDEQARSNLMWDSAMAENGILKLGRKTDFQCHMIEHQLGAYTDCNHGQGLAVIQPVYYAHILNDAPEKFEKIAKEVFGKQTAEEGLQAYRDFVKECGLASKMSDLRSDVEITPELLRKVADSTMIMQSNPRTLDADEIYEILMECMQEK